MSASTRRVVLSRNFSLSFFSFFLIWISFDFFILFPLYILERGGDSVDVGIQTAIFYFPSVLIRPVAGLLSDRIGRLKVLWFGSLLMVITGFAFLPLQGPYLQIRWWVAGILLLRGTAFAAFYTAFFTYVADLTTSQNRARIIGLFGVSGLIGHGLAPRIAETVLQQYGFTGFFTACGLLALLSLLISLGMKEVHSPSLVQERGIVIFRNVTFSSRNWVILPGAFVFGFVVASFTTFGAAYFKVIGKVSVGYFFLVYGVVAAVVRIFFGGIADRYSRWKLICLFFVLQGLGVLILIMDPRNLYWLSAACMGGAHSILFPAMTAMAIDAHPQQFRGVVTSVFTGTMELGLSLGAYLQGVVVAIFGYDSMFGTTAAVALAFSVYVLIFQIRQPRQLSTEFDES